MIPREIGLDDRSAPCGAYDFSNAPRPVVGMSATTSESGVLFFPPLRFRVWVSSARQFLFRRPASYLSREVAAKGTGTGTKACIRGVVRVSAPAERLSLRVPERLAEGVSVDGVGHEGSRRMSAGIDRPLMGRCCVPCSELLAEPRTGSM